MELQKTNLDGCFLIKKAIFTDHRGFFTETYNKKDFDEVLVTDLNFVQDNLSMSLKGVVRGLHYQINNPQGKLNEKSSVSVSIIYLIVFSCLMCVNLL